MHPMKDPEMSQGRECRYADREVTDTGMETLGSPGRDADRDGRERSRGL